MRWDRLSKRWSISRCSLASTDLASLSSWLEYATTTSARRQMRQLQKPYIEIHDFERLAGICQDCFIEVLDLNVLMRFAYFLGLALIALRWFKFKLEQVQGASSNSRKCKLELEKFKLELSASSNLSRFKVQSSKYKFKFKFKL